MHPHGGEHKSAKWKHVSSMAESSLRGYLLKFDNFKWERKCYIYDRLRQTCEDIDKFTFA